MRKLLIFVLLILLLAAYRHNGFIIFTAKYGGAYGVYRENEDFEASCDLSFFEAVLKKTKGGVKGESVRFMGSDQDIEDIIRQLNIKVVDKQTLAGVVTIYGYSPRLGDYVSVSGEKVNIQIARRGAVVTVGVPLIMGSY